MVSPTPGAVCVSSVVLGFVRNLAGGAGAGLSVYVLKVLASWLLLRSKRDGDTSVGGTKATTVQKPQIARPGGKSQQGQSRESFRDSGFCQDCCVECRCSTALPEVDFGSTSRAPSTAVRSSGCQNRKEMSFLHMWRCRARLRKMSFVKSRTCALEPILRRFSMQPAKRGAGCSLRTMIWNSGKLQLGLAWPVSAVDGSHTLSLLGEFSGGRTAVWWWECLVFCQPPNCWDHQWSLLKVRRKQVLVATTRPLFRVRECRLMILVEDWDLMLGL